MSRVQESKLGLLFDIETFQLLSFTSFNVSTLKSSQVHFQDFGHFSACWQLIIQPSTEFFEACVVEENNFKLFVLCTVKKNKNKNRKKKKRNNSINSVRNYRREMKLIPIDVDYCLLQFDALKIFLGVHLHGIGSLPNFNFFNVNPQM